jgi:hypothetical protein
MEAPMHAWKFSGTEVVQLLAVLMVAVCLVPAGAHLFELPHKMALPPEQYMTVQAIYAGWSLFGIPIAIALVLTASDTWLVRSNRAAFALSLVALLCLIATQAIFWTFTYPMNVGSANWTRMPENFEAARRQWEYSHAVNAVVTFAALVAITLSAVGDRHALSQAAEWLGLSFVVGSRDELGVFLRLALERQEVVVAATSTWETAAQRRPCLVHCAAALLRIKEAARHSENLVGLSPH